jgi:hypothetical protein
LREVFCAEALRFIDSDFFQCAILGVKADSKPRPSLALERKLDEPLRTGVALRLDVPRKRIGAGFQNISYAEISCALRCGDHEPRPVCPCAYVLEGPERAWGPPDRHVGGRFSPRAHEVVAVFEPDVAFEAIAPRSNAELEPPAFGGGVLVRQKDARERLDGRCR